MDILNWLYLVKKKFLRTSVENPDTDLIALGADVSFAKRGDKYQSYVVPFGSAVAELDGNILRTGIYDEYTNGGDYIFGVGVPVLSKTSTKVIDTPAAPTFVNVDLQGWKLSGSVNIDAGYAGDLIYLGSIEFESVPFWDMFPWKTDGQVFGYNNSNGLYSTLGNGAMMYDDNAGDAVPVNFYIWLSDYSTSNGNGYDVYLAYEQSDLSAQLYGVASFQFEFLTPTQITPQYYFMNNT